VKPSLFIYLILLNFGLLSAEGKVVLCLGDSLTAGYQIPAKTAWPKLLENTLKTEGKKVRVINSGISGSTTSSAMGRLKWHIKGKGTPDIVVIALGANDGLRGQDTEAMRKNLSNVIDYAQENGSVVLLAGMKIPPNYGQEYTRRFEQVYVDLSKKKNVASIPFLLEGVAAIPKLNLPDGIHPNIDGHKIVSGVVLKHLRPLLKP